MLQGEGKASDTESQDGKDLIEIIKEQSVAEEDAKLDDALVMNAQIPVADEKQEDLVEEGLGGEISQVVDEGKSETTQGVDDLKTKVCEVDNIVPVAEQHKEDDYPAKESTNSVATEEEIGEEAGPGTVDSKEGGEVEQQDDIKLESGEVDGKKHEEETSMVMISKTEAGDSEVEEQVTDEQE